MRIGDRIRKRRTELGMTVEDLAALLGRNRATVYRYESNFIENMPTSVLEPLAQALQTTPAYLMGWDNETENADIISFPNILPIQAFRIPILGTINCGEPAYADQDFQGYVAVGTGIQADFALRCKGDSMIGARIYDGDIVFIRRQPDVEDGEIAAVILDDEATLKRVYKLADGRVQLRAENPRYAPIIVGGESDVRSVRILGKAVAFQANVV